MSKIFNQFEQAHALIASQHGGTGLGLSIVKSLVEVHGGTIHVTSEPGAGSTFVVTLSYKNSLLPPLQDPVDGKESASPFLGKVLVVDDDALILRLCGIILEKHRIPFSMYPDARSLIQEGPDPNVTHILMDIRMPDMSGVELCGILRGKYRDATLFVAITAHVFPQEQQHLLQNGFDKVLAKPFRESELLRVFGITETPGKLNPSHTPPDIDLSVLRKMTFGDEGLFQSIILQFIEETENDLLLLVERLDNSDVAPVREVVHKLAGRMGQVGINDLAAKLRELETSLEQGTSLSKLTGTLRGVKDEIEQLLIKFRKIPLAAPR